MRASTEKGIGQRHLAGGEIGAGEPGERALPRLNGLVLDARQRLFAGPASSYSTAANVRAQPSVRCRAGTAAGWSITATQTSRCCNKEFKVHI